MEVVKTCFIQNTETPQADRLRWQADKLIKSSLQIWVIFFSLKKKEFYLLIYDEVQITPNIFSLLSVPKHRTDVICAIIEKITLYASRIQWRGIEKLFYSMKQCFSLMGFKIFDLFNDHNFLCEVRRIIL